MYVKEENIEERSNQIHIITNGQSEFEFTLHYKSLITQSQIQKAYETKWGVKLRRMRLFTDEGVQFNNEDLRYLKNKQNLYVSKGEDFDANSSFSEYQIIRPLGQGGYGMVSLAQHKITKQLVAIKVMKVSGFTNTSQIDLVFRQAQSLQALKHSNIVQIKKCYTLKDMRVIVVMQYMQGGQLLSRLKQKEKFDQSQAKIYFKQIIKAIIYVHNKNIIHRDLKLENILLKSKKQNKVKIADFGISGVSQHINPKSCSGTLKYMSPEVLAGNVKQFSSSVDIWALGVILYYMLIGKQPFIGANTQLTTSLIVSGRYVIPPNSISIEAEQLLSRMLDKNPSTRIKAVQIRDHLWLKTSILQILTNPMQIQLQNIKQFQSKKQIIADRDPPINSNPKLKHTRSMKVSHSRSISKVLKQNEVKLPRLNKSVHHGKSGLKRSTTVERRKKFDSVLGNPLKD